MYKLGTDCIQLESKKSIQSGSPSRTYLKQYIDSEESWRHSHGFQWEKLWKLA